MQNTLQTVGEPSRPPAVAQQVTYR
jgi:hypothetical protein